MRVSSPGQSAPCVQITEEKLKAMRSGCTIDGVRYKGMFVRVEGGGGKGREGRNAWLTIECTEGKVRSKVGIWRRGLTLFYCLPLSMDWWNVGSLAARRVFVRDSAGCRV